MWLHVDAAYGGAARLSQRESHRVPGLERADTVTVDPHKWFFQAYDIGGLVVRRREDLLTAFHREPEYYRSNRPEDEPLHWYQYSLEGTRRFRGLKLWMSWKHLGTDGLGRLIEHNDDLAAYLARRCAEAADFEAEPVRAGAEHRVLPPPADGQRRVAGSHHGRLPDPVAAGAGDQRRGMGEHDRPPRSHVPAGGGRELPERRARRRSDAGAPCAPCQKASSKSSTCADRARPGCRSTLATSNRTRPGLSRVQQQERLREGPDLLLLAGGHRLPSAAEPGASARLHLAEHQRVASREHQVQLPDAAPPVASHHAVAARRVPTGGGLFADRAGGQAFPRHPATVPGGADRLSRRRGRRGSWLSRRGGTAPRR